VFYSVLTLPDFLGSSQWSIKKLLKSNGEITSPNNYKLLAFSS
jgi:hypothetical protein